MARQNSSEATTRAGVGTHALAWNSECRKINGRRQIGWGYTGRLPWLGEGGGSGRESATGADTSTRVGEGCCATPLRDIPSGRCFFTGPWTVTRPSLRMLRRVAAFCRPLRPVLPLVSFPRSRSPVPGVPGLCWMWRDVPFARQRRPVVGALGVVLVVAPPPPPP